MRGSTLPLLHLFPLLLLLGRAASVAIDNGVVGRPEITCGTDEISFWVQTEKPFAGKTYVKGEYGKGECSRTFEGGDGSGNLQRTTTPEGGLGGTCPPCPACPPAQEPPSLRFGRRKRQAPAQPESSGNPKEDDPLMAHLTVRLGTCNVKRDRSLSPAGVTITYTVVVSFHPSFITKVDRAYQIRCFYMEADKTVTSQIDVSMPQTTELTAQASMPTCEYMIRRESPQGPVVRFARVGDKVYHTWECESATADMFGMLVHSCYVNDGGGQRVEVVNRQGCSNDKVAIGDINYETLTSANVESHVFKFADRAELEFQCSISICIQSDGGCDGVTPPQCERSRNARSLGARLERRVNVSEGPRAEALFGAESETEWKLHAPPLTILDLDEDVPEQDLMEMEKRFMDKNAGRQPSSTSPSLADRASQFGGSYYRRLAGRLGPKVCLSVVGFGVLVALSTFVFTLASVIVGTIYVLRRKGPDPVMPH